MKFSKITKAKNVSILGEKVTLTPLVGLVLLVILLRIPSLFEPYWYGDEGIYLTLGEGIKQGLVLYKDMFDHKPPAIYLIAAIAGSLFWFKLTLLIWHTTTVVLFWKLTEKVFETNKKALLLANTIFILLTTLPLLEGNIVNSELFMIGSTIPALLIIFSKKETPKNLFLAGALFSISTLFKVPAIFDFLALCTFLIFTISTKKEILKTGRNILLLTIGLVSPALVSVLYYWSQGSLTQYLDTAWTQNFTYISQWSTPSVTFISTLAQAGLTTRAIIFSIIIFLLFIFKHRFDKITLFASLWFTFALFASLLSGRPYPHYIIQVVPPLALLIAILSFGKEKFRFLPVPFLILFVFTLSFYQFGYYRSTTYYENFLKFATGQKDKKAYFEYFDKRTPLIYELGEIITNRTSKNDRIFIWGTMPELYALSHRVPSGRYTTSFHISDFNRTSETLQSLEENKPKYILIVQEEKRSFPGFYSFLQKNYLYLETVGGVEIWKRTSPGILKALSV
ncbi:MAG: hypothetical protein HYU80_00835 [Candidatus Blackburnbacteria bacterium]|nr:hypothetical protein [Candidatus Blackburnbacteria bacterium]